MRTLVILAALCAAPAAFADPPKYTRKQPLAPTPHLSERVKPRAVATPKPTPTLTPDGIMAVIVQQQPLRREQEVILEKLVKATPDEDPEKPELMFRLAEHYAQQLRFWRLKAIEPTVQRR